LRPYRLTWYLKKNRKKTFNISPSPPLSQENQTAESEEKAFVGTPKTVESDRRSSDLR